MTPNPVEVVNVFGQYGGILGIVVAALLFVILSNMWLGYKRQQRFDDKMLDSVNNSTRAMNNLANAVGRLPCTSVHEKKNRESSGQGFFTFTNHEPEND